MSVRVIFVIILASFLFFTSDVFSIEEQSKSPPYKQGEIIVKFRQGAAETLERQLSGEGTAGTLNISVSLDELSRRHKVKRIKPLIKGFKARRQKISTLFEKDESRLTKREKHILRRLKRASEDAKVPDLDRIYKLELEEGQSTEEAVAEYRRNPDVEYAELNYIVTIDFTPNDPYYPIQWPLNNTGQSYPNSSGGSSSGTADCDIDAPEAWDINTGSSDVIVAVADTGVDYTHRDLQGNMWSDSNGYHGYDFVNSDNYPMDDHGHGTHCAGIIAASGNNGLDIAGVCWGVKIMALKFLDDGGSGSYTNAAAAFYYAVNNGADVISNSWGKDNYSQTMQDAIDYAYSQGVIIVAAAGNDIQYYFPHYPSSMEHVISVAATNSKDKKANFSNYGKWIDISAPGVNILSLRANGTSMGTVYDSYTTIASGTSMSCPHVAGVLGLLLSTYPDISIDEITERLLETADDISEQNPDYMDLLGSGRVNAHKAIRFNFEGRIKLDRDSYCCSDEVEIEIRDFDVRGSGSQQVTLTTEGGDSETVTLAEDSNRPWIFAGAISTLGTTVIVEDGYLQVVHGQVITAVYDDPNYGDIGPSSVQTTATADCEGASIYGVSVHNITSSGAKVRFRTNEPTTGRVRCGTSCGGLYDITGEDETLGIIHDVYLPDLNSQTDYWFVIDVNDAAGNQTTSTNGGQCYAFSTAGIPAGLHVPSEYSTIQAAIDASVNGDTVWVSDGTYTGPGNRNLQFSGKLITVRSENGPKTCIIDCENISRAFTLNAEEGLDTIIRGFTIQNGYSGSSAGAILCRGSSPTISNCVLLSNHADSSGGAIVLGDYTHPSDAVIRDCTFLDNSGDFGGGIYAGKGHQVITNCIFKGNVATYDYGGGICCWQDSVATIENCLMKNNASRNINRGAGISCMLSVPTVKNCLFIDNFAMGSFTAYGGGGIYANHTTANIVNCTFYGNTTTGYGGACYFGGNRDISVTNCIFSKNYPSQIYKDMTSGRVYVTYSDVQGGYSGTGNINADPCFASGPKGDFYLSQVAAGQAIDSPCVDAGSDTAENLAMDAFTTRTDQLSDSGLVDMGYHYSPDIRSADIDENWYVDFLDFAMLADQWLKEALGIPSADISPPGGDGLVDGLDLSLLANSWLECLVEPAVITFPAEGMTTVDPNVILSWTAGNGALEHDVYLGTDSNAVADADYFVEEYMGTVSDVNFDPCLLDVNTTYFWRIDEVRPICTTNGNVWSFTTWAGKPNDSNLVGWWKFDEGSGNMAGDYSCNSNYGVITGATWFDDPYRGICLNFDGADDYVHVDNNDGLNPPQLTVALWFKSDSATRSIITKGTSRGTTSQRDWDIFGTGTELKWLGSDGEDNIWVTATSYPSRGQWHHVVGTWDGTTDSNGVNLYLDGDLVSSTTAENTNLATSHNVKIGGRRPSGNYEFDGKIDNVRIYNRALSEEEVEDIFYGE